MNQDLIRHVLHVSVSYLDVVIRFSRFLGIFTANKHREALSSAEASAGYPDQKKNRKRAGDDGKRERAGASLLSSPFPSCPARSLFLSPQPPHNTKASP